LLPASGGSRGGGWEADAPLIIFWGKEEITEGRKAARASKITPFPLPPPH